MLSGLLSVFKNGAVAKSYMQTLINLVQHFEADLVVDGSSKDAAIDDACQYLQSLKTPKAAAPANAPASPASQPAK